MRARSLWLICLAFPVSLFAQNYNVRTIAGFGTYGGDGGPATAALVSPMAVTVDANGTLYVSDPVNFRIRKIDTSGTITTLIGRGYGTFIGDDGAAASAGMSTAQALALDAAGNLYFTDDNNNRIREVTSSGTVRTVAGNGNCGIPTNGMAATRAPLCDVDSVAVDSQGRVYFGSNSQIWMIASNGTLTLVAGNGGTDSTGDSGPATSAQVGYPGSIAIDQSGNLYFADLYNFNIREITSDHIIHPVVTISDLNASTIAVAVDSSGSLFYVTGTKNVFKFAGTPTLVAIVPTPSDASSLAIDRNGVFYVSSRFTQRLLKVSGAGTLTIAGALPQDLEPLPRSATSVHLFLTAVDSGVAVDSSGNVYFAELDNNLLQRIDKVSPSGTMSVVPTPAKLPGTNIDFTAGALTIGPSGSIYFCTFTQVYRVESNGSLTLIAGGPGFPANLGDGGPATAAKVTSPTGLAFDQAGNLYIAEPFASRVRRVTPGGTITTFAGNGQAGYSGDNGPATSAKLAAPVDVKVDNNGNLYIADVSAAVVRKVTPNGVITTVAGNGTHGFSGDGGPAIQAELSGAAAIALDPSGNLFIADRSQAGGTFVATPDNNRLRMVNPSGTITTIAGPTPGYNGEGIILKFSAIGGPVALAADAQGNIYVSEGSTERVRKLTPGAGAVPDRRRGAPH